MSLHDSREPDAYLTPVQYSHVKIGKYLMIKGHPCKVTNLLTSKPGKHGSCKVNVTGLCQHCNKKFNMAGLPGHGTGQQPEITSFELELITIDNNQFHIMDDDGCMYEEAEFYPAIHEEIEQKLEEAQQKNKSCLITLTRMPLEERKGIVFLYEKVEFSKIV